MNYLVKIEDHWIPDTSIHELLTTDYLSIENPWVYRDLILSLRSHPMFTIGFMWCLEKSKLMPLKLNKRKKAVRACEPCGHFFYSLLELSLHTYSLTKHSRTYSSPYLWFSGVLDDVLVKSFSMPVQELTKAQCIKSQRENIEQLKNYQNPIPPIHQTHLWNLVSAAILLARQSPEWDREWFRGNQKDPNSLGLIAAYKRYVRSLEQKDVQHLARAIGILPSQ